MRTAHEPQQIVVGNAHPTLALCLLLCLLALPSTTFAQRNLWEYTPYRVQVFVALDRDPALTPALVTDLQRQLLQRSEAVVGSPWDVETHVAPANLAHALRWRFSELTFDELPRELLQVDKALFVRVSRSPSGYEVTARELDVRTRQFSPIVTREVLQRQLLATEAFEAALEAFSPLAQVETAKRRSAELRLRAASLPTRDPQLTTLVKGNTFRPVLRFNNTDGSLKKIVQIPWSFLASEGREGALVRCRVHTGVRSPLTSRRRGRVEQLCLSVRPPRQSTRVELHSYTDDKYPLAGYEVYVYGPDSKATEFLGYTDRLGGLTVPPSPFGVHPLRLLLVKNGGEPLAKLPIVPGLEPIAAAPVRNDEQRLRVEGFITGLQERMVYVVAKRRLLVVSVRKRIKAGRIKQAEQLFKRLKDLPTLDTFRKELNDYQRRPDVLTNDQLIKSKIDKLFGDTRKVLETHLVSPEVTELATQLQAAKVAAR